MPPAFHLRNFAAGLAAITTTALLVRFGTGLVPWWPLLWFTPLPILLLSARVSRPMAALSASSAWVLGSLNMWSYYHGSLELPSGAVVGIVAGMASIFTLAVLLFRALLRRGAYWSALIAFPALWVSFEYVMSLVSPHGTFGSLAYTQIDFLPLLQLASITGPWGISFLVLVFPAAAAVSLYRGTQAARPRQVFRFSAVIAAILAAVLAFGFLRLSRPVPGERVTVGLVASDKPAEMAAEGAPARRLFSQYATQAKSLAADGAQVVVMPEKLGVISERDAKDIDSVFQSLADRTGADIVTGLIFAEPKARHNQARIYQPRGPVLEYDKHHMLPPFESGFKPGDSLLLMKRPSGIRGIAVCKDMDFPPLARRYGRAGAGLMLVPAWDFVVDRRLHGRMAVMRGVESGFSVVRAARQGNLTASDSRGRILAETTSDSAHFATLTAKVPAAHDRTLYLRLGDWFAWAVMALLIAALLPLLGPYRRR